MANKFKIVQMEKEHVKAVAQILRATFHHDDSNEVNEDFIEELVKNYNELSFVGMSGKIVAGFILVRKRPKNLYIDQFAVLEKYRGKKLGGTLLGKVVEKTKEIFLMKVKNNEKHFDFIYLWVPTDKDSESAIHLYEKYGFKRKEEKNTLGTACVKMIKKF